MFNFETVLNSYIAAALWSSTDDKGEHLDKKHNKGDISEETLSKIKKDITNFLKEAEQYLKESELDDGQIGHDFWLTRNRHGVGFWDRGSGKSKEINTALKKISDISSSYGETDLYIGDDKKIYSMP